MRAGRVFFLAWAALAACGTSAHAVKLPGQDHLSLQYPGAPQTVHDEAQSPYAMNYADEVAQSLGIKNRHVDVFSTEPGSSGYMPSFSAGLGSDGAMFRLKWHPGE
jgi:hypothetical protein